MNNNFHTPVFDALEPRLLLSGDLFITELMAANTSTVTDNTGQYSDWLEIFNASPNDINLLGYHLTDDGADLNKWPLPDKVLPAGGYLLIFASGNDLRNPAAELHTNFKLSADGELLALVAPDQSIEHAYQPQFPGQSSDISYGLSLDLASQGYFPTPTPGQPNVTEPVSDARQQILVSEIMYHPASENDFEEYIEIHNSGSTAVDLTGWQITRGIDFTFPATIIDPGQYIVIAADPATFATTYPAAPTPLGPWIGHLRNSGETVNLQTDDGTTVDEVRFADEGDWAVRQLDGTDHGHQGWNWQTSADAGGKSIELVNMDLDNNQGQNWLPSIPDGGTPGQPNSVAANDIAPLISNVTHYPIIPTASEPVTISATISDEQSATSLNANLYYRVDGTSNFTQVPMSITLEGKASATVPAMPDGTVIEYYIEATDAQNNTRTWPAPTQPDGQQSANALYQVDDSFDINTAWTPGQQPVYYLIMTEAQRAELEDIGDANEDGIDESDSNAQMNGTFIALSGTGIELHYNVGIRNRGHGSRTGPPNNYRVNFRHDDPWQGVTAININKLSSYSQVLGSVIHKLAGHQPADAMAVQVRVNGQNLAEADNNMYGSYAAVEVLDGDYADNHYPTDSDGNLYKCLDSYTGDEADLQYEGTDPDEYRDTYFKQTNDYLDDWTDLIALTDALNNTPTENYYDAVAAVANIEQWVSYFALDTLLGNTEGGLITGRGDDYALYRGVNDQRFTIVPHDLDSLFRGSTQRDIFVYTNVPGLQRFFDDPQITQLYYQTLISHINTFYNPQTLFPLIDDILAFVPDSQTDQIKQFIVDRIDSVLSQVPREFTVDSTMPLLNGYYHAFGSNALIFGHADVVETQSILVNGETIYYNPVDGSWSTGGYASGGNETLINRGEVWQYLDNGSNQTNTGWQNNDYVPGSAWGEGPAQLGYGDGDEATVVGDGTGSGDPYVTFYFRKTIQINNAADITNLDLSLLRDDGAVVYINGNEILRSNMDAGPIDYLTYANATASDENVFNHYSIDPAYLNEGDNVISVEIHQRSATSSDVSFDMQLTATRSDASTETLITQGDTWYYLDDGSDQTNSDWKLLSYTLSADWNLGVAEFGYGDSDEATVLDSGGGGSSTRAITTYFRKTFTVNDISDIGNLTMMLLRDDGAVVYLNGTEVLRSNMPAGNINYLTLTDGDVTGSDEGIFVGPFNINPALLIEGENVIAVEIHQRSTSSSDISFDLDLIAARGEISGGAAIQPGLNRLTIEAYDGPDGTGNLINSAVVNVWLDENYSAANILPATTLTENLTLTPDNGPWTITGEINVPAGYTLTIEPGTELYFEDGARIMVDGGQLIAEGTAEMPILFTKTGSASAWGGIQFNNTLLDNRIAYATLQFGITTDGMIGLDWSNLTVTHSTFDHTDRRRIRSQNSSLIVRDSYFTDIFPGDMAATTNNQSEHLWGGHVNPGGHFIIERNYFGTTKGHNDVIDFDAGTRGVNPVPQYINNIFAGSGDDLLDLEGDSFIEGNIFMNVHKDVYNTDPGESNTISAGAGHEFMVVNNVFYNIGHVSLVKEESFMTFLHNTVIDADLTALYFELPGETSGPGIGGFFENNIFTNVAENFDYLELTTDFSANNNIVAPDAASLGTGNFVADPRIADAGNQDFSLLPGSPAMGAAPGGYDLGALIPGGKAILITGGPQAFTNDTSATFNVYAPGYIAYRYRVNGGQWSDDLTLDTPIELNGLADGQYTVEVIAQNWAYSWTDESEAVSCRTWTVNHTVPIVLINEIMADNESFYHDGTLPDMIELHNPSGVAADISGYTITDDPTRPGRFTFPANTIIQPGEYLVLYADSNVVTTGIHLGFALDRNGEGVYLYNPVAIGGNLVDSIEFGIQPADHSIGRAGYDRTWTINTPTFGQENQAITTGYAGNLRINEWGANGDQLYTDDFIELYNPDPLPVSLADLHLTDDPIANRDKFTIAPLSFIAANGFTVFKADGNPDTGHDHTNFRLNSRMGGIGLFNSDLTRIDQVFYYASTIDASHGLAVDGESGQQAFANPTPGRSNHIPVVVTIPGDTNLDGRVDLLDLVTLGENYNQPGDWSKGDFNGDGHVDLLDLVTLGENYNSGATMVISKQASDQQVTDAAALWYLTTGNSTDGTGYAWNPSTTGVLDLSDDDNEQPVLLF